MIPLNGSELITYNKTDSKRKNYQQRNRKSTGAPKIHQGCQLFTQINHASIQQYHSLTKPFITENS